MDFTWVKRKDCKVLLQDSTLVGKAKTIEEMKQAVAQGIEQSWNQ